MKRIIRYLTRWAWTPVIQEFVLRQVHAEKEARRISNHATRMFDALQTIAYTKGCTPVLVARKAITKEKPHRRP
jgi:hypothetical protein